MKKLFALLSVVVTFLPCSTLAKPLVLSSLNPLTLIVKEVGGSTIDTDTLLPVTASHHDYPLKTSDYMRLKKADLVVWVGPELESFLAKPVANLPMDHLLTVYDLAGLYWPPIDKNEGEHHHEQDPHIWLDPRNAIVVARAVGERLGKIDPANKSQYDANVQAFAAKMIQLDQMLSAQLKPLSNKGFAVYHEGFAHFIHHYGLRELDYVTFTPEQKPGAKHIDEMRERLKKDGVCLFLEPYNESSSVRALAQELHLKTGTLDAMGSQNSSGYSQLLESMAQAFSTCLANR